MNVEFTKSVALSVLAVLLISLNARAAQDASDPTGEKAWLVHGFTESQRQSLRDAFRWGIENHFIPGGALLIIDQGEPVFREAFGLADVEAGKPFTVDAPCRIASVTKPHTATLMAMLVEQGKLSWDDPVDKYLPGFAGMQVRGRGSAAQSPKIRELLSHTAGFPSNTARRSGEQSVEPNATMAQVVDRLSRAELAAEPGSVFAYTGLGYIVAGRIAEIVTGQEFAALMKERLFMPLGATTATFYSSATQALKAQMPTMYERQGGRLVKADIAARSEAAAAFPNPGGGLVSTLDDVGRFLMLHRNRGMVEGKRLISSKSLDALYRRQPATGRTGYGLGFNIMGANADGVGYRVRHTGASGTLALLDFKQDLLVVMLTQVPTKQTQPFSNRLMKAINSVFPNR
jgi:CubicO group peptidase (beta-lactamase class C family)